MAYISSRITSICADYSRLIVAHSSSNIGDIMGDIRFDVAYILHYLAHLI